MSLLGILTGFIEVVIGILVLCNSRGEAVLVGVGIGYILSGLLFMWLCVGASTAFSDSKRISDLENENKDIKNDNRLLQEILVHKGVINREELDTLVDANVPIEKMEDGFPLITLIEKSFKDGEIVIPIHTRVLFHKYDAYSYSEPAVIVTYSIDGKLTNFKYAKTDVMNASLYELLGDQQD